MITAADLIAGAGPAQVQVLADGLFTSGTSIAYMIEGLRAAVALVVGTVATLGKAGKEGAGSGITHQFLVIGLSVTIFLSAGLAAAVTSSFESHGVRNGVNVPNPYGQ
jgi:hypothetical protein